MKLTSEEKKIAMQAKSPEEFLKLAAENGYQISNEEAQEAMPGYRNASPISV